MKSILDFKTEREELNKKALEFSDKTTQRFFSIDSSVYQAGALDKKTKELMGLCASMVMRCDDCIKYHLIESHKAGATDDEIKETFSIALVIGGSIVIPNLRKAVASWQEIKGNH